MSAASGLDEIGLIVSWAEVAESGMQPLPVVENLDELEDGSPGLT